MQLEIEWSPTSHFSLEGRTNGVLSYEIKKSNGGYVLESLLGNQWMSLGHFETLDSAKAGAHDDLND